MKHIRHQPTFSSLAKAFLAEACLSYVLSRIFCVLIGYVTFALHNIDGLNRERRIRRNEDIQLEVILRNNSLNRQVSSSIHVYPRFILGLALQMGLVLCVRASWRMSPKPTMDSEAVCWRCVIKRQCLAMFGHILPSKTPKIPKLLNSEEHGERERDHPHPAKSAKSRSHDIVVAPDAILFRWSSSIKLIKHQTFENTSCHSLVFCFASIVLSFDNDLKWTATEGCPACETRSCSAACVQAQHWLEIFFFEFNCKGGGFSVRAVFWGKVSQRKP